MEGAHIYIRKTDISRLTTLNGPHCLLVSWLLSFSLVVLLFGLVWSGMGTRVTKRYLRSFSCKLSWSKVVDWW